MPTREQIISHFNASPVTVNSALAELRVSGFVEVRGNQGTYVTGSLPNQTRYAVTFGQIQGNTDSQGYVSALAKECALVHKTQVDDRELEIVPFYGLMRAWDSPDYGRLLAEIRAHRIAGIIAANFTSTLLEAEELVSSKVPLVVNTGITSYAHFSTVTLDGASAARESLGFLAERGVKRPGIIFSVKDNNVWSQAWIDMASKFGMTIEPYWLQMAHLDAPSAARQIAHLMMMQDGNKHPDGLVISDDNLAPYATAGLIEAGLTATSDFPIAVHANFPWPTVCHLPAMRVGYDIRDMIRVCIGIIDRMRVNGGVVEHLTVPAMRQWEANTDIEGGR